MLLSMHMQILEVKTRQQFYKWLKENHYTKSECYVPVKRGNPDTAVGILSYIDAVECALCFGWIDSTWTSVNKVMCSRFSPRHKDSPWTELNKERCRRLIRLGEMTQEGLRYCPNLEKEYAYPKRIINILSKNIDAYEFFCKCPLLYRNIRIYNVDFYYKRNRDTYKKALNNLIENCRKHKMYGQWDDYGRLSK